MKLLELRDYICELALRISLNEADLPTFGSARGDGSPNVEVSESGFSYVESERGHEYGRFTTDNLEDFTYFVLSKSVGSWGSMQRRIPSTSPARKRVIWLSWECYLLGLIKPEWRARRLAEARGLVAREKLATRLSSAEIAMAESYFSDSGFAASRSGFSTDGLFAEAVLVERSLRFLNFTHEDAAEVASCFFELTTSI